MSRNDLTPGTATESQTEGHRAAGTEKPARTFQTTAERVAVSPGGHSPLSHGIIVRRFTSAEIREALKKSGEHLRPYFRKGGRLWP